MLLLIDNYDSFAHNLARYLRRLGQDVLVLRNDAADVDQVLGRQPDAIVISPGPCTPDEAGICVDLVRAAWRTTPILGVCLGHQAIAAAFGARISRLTRPAHGVSGNIYHDGDGVFAGLPTPFSAGRYHSLVVDEASLGDGFFVSARLDDGTVMAIQRRDAPVWGLQFHPESVMTPLGYPILARFLEIAGLQPHDAAGLWAREYQPFRNTGAPLPEQPVTF